MKRFFFFMVMVLLVGSSLAVQPARKPFLQIKIDGKAYKNGDILTVTAGQKLVISAELEGGRRDFCKFPDTYADIAGTAQILSRGNDGLSYELNGVKSEWKILNERYLFSGDENVKVNSLINSSTAEVTISNTKFSQSFVKVTGKAKWQFISNGNVTEEENTAEGTVYFKVSGSSDVWFSSQNVQAGGMKNDKIQEKLNLVQAQFDSIENNFFKLKFTAVQQSIRSLQAAVNDVKATIDEVKTGNASYKINVIFIGLPSDKPFNDINTLATIKTEWATLDLLLEDLKLQTGKLSTQPTSENKDELVRLIEKLNDWQFHLPENTFKILSRYIPEMSADSMQIPGNIHFIGEEKKIVDYPQTFSSFNAFLDQRIGQLPDENQKITTTQSRLQAVRLFDGMLRSYFSSINWAEWKNTRE
jgi:hypothetical protein